MASPMHNPFPQFLRNFKTYAGRLPLRISQRALNEMKNNFSRQGYDSDSGFRSWKALKKTEKGSRRALLIKHGRLRRSLRAAPLPNMPRVVTDVPYAEALNDGFKGTVNVRPHKRTASRKVTIRGGYQGVGVKQKVSTGRMTGSRHNVKGFSRKVDIPARPFLTVGPAFLDREETRMLDEIENLFLQA